MRASMPLPLGPLRNRAFAVVVTAAVHAMLLLFFVTRLSEPSQERPGAPGAPALTLIDLAHDEAESDSAPPTMAAPSPTPVQVPKPTPLPVPPAEWKMVAVAVPSAAARSSGGNGASGSGSGAGATGGGGDDPYAGAGYRVAGSAVERHQDAAAQLASTYLPAEVDRAQLQRLLLALDAKLKKVAFSLRVTADASGKALVVEALAPAPPPSFAAAKRIIETALNRQRLLLPNARGTPQEAVLGPFILGSL